MSLEPLLIQAGHKTASVFAGLCGIGLVVAASVAAGGVMLWVFEGDDEGLLAGGLIAVAVMAAIGQLLVRLALGRHRTRGGILRFTRYQLGAIGIGAVLGLAGLPLLTLSGTMPLLTSPLEWIVCCTLAAAIGAGSVLCFLPDRRRPGQVPPRPGHVAVPGIVAHHWMSPPQIMTFDISVIRYTGPDEQERFVRHLYRQAVTLHGIVDEAHVDQGRPELVTAFFVPKLSSKRAMRDAIAAMRDQAERGGSTGA